ncbi:TRMT1-like protein isoform X2 [Ruditapes philippinarum]|uniref:TRMT1-like protein isoform X2 n=1 Tax=Ruditapes philippinarum TaxID=129788 RepID=UPI00295C126D|nr:TRMT1-like protein isoform X2 [Ruditapes philippinarum]
MAETVEENKVKIEIPQGLKHAAKIKYFNPKLAMLREAVLATVQIEADKLVKPLQCLDAFSGSGLTGLQWKLHLGNKVHVVLSEGTHIKESCELNEMKHSDWLLDATRTTGEWPSAEQSEQEVNVCPFKASIVLHEEAFNFVFLQRLFNNIAQYTDSVFSNLRQNGVACFLTPNISSACFRSPQIIQRLYGAHTQKTEYIDELAVRVFIADLAKAAARYQKGITVLYTISDEDHFLVVVRVTKNNQSSISCVENCRPFLHCLMCEERVVFPQTNSPIENPYSLLPCECKTKHPGKTAVILGPLWVGEIFSISFIEQLLICTQDKSTDVCLKLRTLLKSLLEEARCPSENGNSVSLTQVKEESNKGGTVDHSEPVLKKPKLENGGQSENETQESVTMSEKVSESQCKHSEIKTEENCTEKNHAMPLFYYNIQNKKYKSLPKLDKLVILLRAAGHRACRTHFQHHAVRTSANLSQLHNIVHKLIK